MCEKMSRYNKIFIRVIRSSVTSVVDDRLSEAQESGRDWPAQLINVRARKDKCRLENAERTYVYIHVRARVCIYVYTGIAPYNE